MKIAMIGHKRVPSREGGIEVVVQELAERMVRKGNEVTLYNRRPKNKPKSPDTYNGMTLRDVPTVNVMGSDAVIYSIMATVSALFGHYDVVHFHAEGPAGMSWLTRLFRIPTVVTIHGLDWQRGKWSSAGSKYLKLSERTAARCADEMIVLSENMGGYFQETYGRKTDFIRNGINVGDPQPPQEILKLGLKGDDYILFLARIVPEKGVHYLLKAFRGMDTDMKLVIAGGLNTSEYAQSVRDLAAGDQRVILTGFVQGRLLEELYSNCRLYVLPSDVEGMPLSLLEALSYGAPCLASDIHENRVAPEEHLSFFRHSEPEDLRLRMEEALREPRPRDMREAQRAWMKENYSWDYVVDETLDLYREAIGKKKGNVDLVEMK